MRRSWVVFCAVAVAAALVAGVLPVLVPQGQSAVPQGFAPGSSASVGSEGGLALSLSLTRGVIPPGGGAEVTVVETNDLPLTNNVSAADSWALPDLGPGPCGAGLPIRIEVLQGYYSSLSPALASAVPLNLSLSIVFLPTDGPSVPAGISCPLELNVTSYSFLPSGDVAAVSCGPSQCGLQTERFSASIGSYMEQGQPAAFPPGVYTIVAGDEWGALVVSHVVVTPSSGGYTLLPAGASLEVTSSEDCLAGHASLNFPVQQQSVLSGGYSASSPGVTLYFSTSLQASDTYQGHPESWIFSTGLQSSSTFAVVLPPGSYVVWIEGADMNCGASVVTPLEMLTEVNVTQGFILSA